MNRDDIIILDGGMGRELEQSGAPFRQPEWSALALMEAPDLVQKAHENFINAGANVITTNSYALVPYHIGQDRFDEKAAELIALSGSLAKAAVEHANPNTKIAGCIPPLFGSYRPQAFEPENADSVIVPLIDNQEGYIDFWLVETLSSSQEAVEILKRLKARSKKQIWAALTLTDDNTVDEPVYLRSGEIISETLEKLNEQKLLPDALLFNCSQPEFIKAALRETNDYFAKNNVMHIKAGAYANSFVKKQHKPANAAITDLREDITPERYMEFAKEWVECGARIIGGCCGIGPEYIKMLSTHLK